MSAREGRFVLRLCARCPCPYYVSYVHEKGCATTAHQPAAMRFTDATHARETIRHLFKVGSIHASSARPVRLRAKGAK